MVLRLSKQFDFQMAHALSEYEGKCRNLHGHNYRLIVTVESGEMAAKGEMGESGEEVESLVPGSGMVMDFGAIKRLVEERIIERYDHALVVAKGSPFEGIEGTKMIVTEFQPTCENLLIHFAGVIRKGIPEGVRLYSVKLYETETSCAEIVL